MEGCRRLNDPATYWNNAGARGYGAAMFGNSLVEQHVNGRAWAAAMDIGRSMGLTESDRVLDLGCGAGLDSVVAAERTGRNGRVIGIDFSAEMLGRACGGGRSHVQFVRASAEQLPLRDAGLDVALVNGIFNLNPARAEIFRELARVLRPGAQVFGAELALRSELPESMQSSDVNWFS